MVLLKRITELESVFPAYGYPVDNADSLKESYGSVDAGPVSLWTALLQELTHRQRLRTSQDPKDSCPRTSHAQPMLCQLAADELERFNHAAKLSQIATDLQIPANRPILVAKT